jgi:transcription initiation factor TFIIH subunit 4
MGLANIRRALGLNSNNESNLQITNKGFQFLLQDVNTQVWAFLLQYLDMAEVSIIGGMAGSISY